MNIFENDLEANAEVQRRLLANGDAQRALRNYIEQSKKLAHTARQMATIFEEPYMRSVHRPQTLFCLHEEALATVKAGTVRGRFQIHPKSHTRYAVLEFDGMLLVQHPVKSRSDYPPNRSIRKALIKANRGIDLFGEIPLEKRHIVGIITHVEHLNGTVDFFIGIPHSNPRRTWIERPFDLREILGVSQTISAQPIVEIEVVAPKLKPKVKKARAKKEQWQKNKHTSTGTD